MSVRQFTHHIKYEYARVSAVVIGRMHRLKSLLTGRVLTITTPPHHTTINRSSHQQTQSHPPLLIACRFIPKTLNTPTNQTRSKHANKPRFQNHTPNPNRSTERVPISCVLLSAVFAVCRNTVSASVDSCRGTLYHHHHTKTVNA